MARRIVLALAVAFALGGAAAPSTFAANGPGNTPTAREIVTANIGGEGTDIPAPNGEGVLNNPVFPDGALNSLFRNPICDLYGEG